MALAGAALLCAIGAVTTTSAAAPTQREIAEARQLFAEAEKDEAAGRWAEALRKLEQVAAIKETAGVRFHIATCLSHLGRLLESVEGFERARDLAREQKADDVLAMVDQQVGQVRKRIPIIRVSIPSSVQGAQVTLDGKPIAPEQLGEILVDPGTHQVIITVGGKDRVDRYVKLADGQSETVELRTQPVGSTRAAPAPAPVSTGSGAKHGRSAPVLAWVAMGTGAVLGVGGYLAYRRADSLASESAEVCAHSVVCDPARKDVVRRWDATALGLWIGGAAALGTGGTLLLTHDRTDKGLDVALVVAPDAVGLRGRFQ